MSPNNQFGRNERQSTKGLVKKFGDKFGELVERPQFPVIWQGQRLSKIIYPRPINITEVFMNVEKSVHNFEFIFTSSTPWRSRGLLEDKLFLIGKIFWIIYEIDSDKKWPINDAPIYGLFFHMHPI